MIVILGKMVKIITVQFKIVKNVDIFTRQWHEQIFTYHLFLLLIHVPHKLWVEVQTDEGCFKPLTTPQLTLWSFCVHCCKTNSKTKFNSELNLYGTKMKSYLRMVSTFYHIILLSLYSLTLLLIAVFCFYSESRCRYSKIYLS